MKSILVVEDDPVSAMVLERMLGKYFNVKVVNNAQSCSTLCESNNFDFILMDINLGLGSIDGVELMQILKALSGCKNSFFAAMTAYAMPGDKEKYKKMGFDLYFPKPIVYDQLINTLNSFGEDNSVGVNSGRNG